MLSAVAVQEVFLDCFFKDGEDTTGIVPAEGVISKVGFNPAKLTIHQQKIEEFLEELPEGFKDGMSFLAACEDKHGNQWGEHQNMEQLFQLGIAIGKVKCLLPKEMWSALPGGMPYYKVL